MKNISTSIFIAICTLSMNPAGAMDRISPATTSSSQSDTLSEDALEAMLNSKKNPTPLTAKYLQLHFQDIRKFLIKKIQKQFDSVQQKIKAHNPQIPEEQHHFAILATYYTLYLSFAWNMAAQLSVDVLSENSNIENLSVQTWQYATEHYWGIVRQQAWFFAEDPRFSISWNSTQTIVLEHYHENLLPYLSFKTLWVKNSLEHLKLQNTQEIVKATHRFSELLTLNETMHYGDSLITSIYYQALIDAPADLQPKEISQKIEEKFKKFEKKYSHISENPYTYSIRRLLKIHQSSLQHTN